MDKLEALGLIRRFRRGRRLSNTYQFLWHSWFSTEVQPASHHSEDDVQRTASHQTGDVQPTARGDVKPTAQEFSQENSVQEEQLAGAREVAGSLKAEWRETTATAESNGKPITETGKTKSRATQKFSEAQNFNSSAPPAPARAGYSQDDRDRLVAAMTGLVAARSRSPKKIMRPANARDAQKVLDAAGGIPVDALISHFRSCDLENAERYGLFAWEAKRLATAARAKHPQEVAEQSSATSATAFGHQPRTEAENAALEALAGDYERQRAELEAHPQNCENCKGHGVRSYGERKFFCGCPAGETLASEHGGILEYLASQPQELPPSTAPGAVSPESERVEAAIRDIDEMAAAANCPECGGTGERKILTAGNRTVKLQCGCAASEGRHLPKLLSEASGGKWLVSDWGVPRITTQADLAAQRAAA